MTTSFETMGNATVVVYEDGKPILATDPWMSGAAYFGSWALERPLDERQLQTIHDAEYIWFSHGHPDHFHYDSVMALPRDKKVILPDFYYDDIKTFLESEGFSVRVAKYREWVQLSDNVKMCCMDNMNQDTIIVVETSDGLIINKNDSPFMGEFHYLRSLVKKWPREKVWFPVLCAIDADMKNIVDADGNRTIEPPEVLKRGMVWSTARDAHRLGVGNFCCSSSQHYYVREDSIWANEYLLTWKDIQDHWTRPDVKIWQPFVTVDMASGTVTPAPPDDRPKPEYDPTGGGDDWDTRLTEEEWEKVTEFFQQFETLEDIVEFVAITVGGERRDIPMNNRSVPPAERRGIHFLVPAQSLMECVTYGYFDDLLIGNFMKTELINTQLYPEFTPRIAKYGGNAKVYSKEGIKKFKAYYRNRNIWAYLNFWTDQTISWTVMPALRKIAKATGTMALASYCYRRLRGDLAKAG